MAENDDTPPAASPKPPARRAPRKAAAPKKPAATATDKPAAPKRARKTAVASAASGGAATTKATTKVPPKPRSSKRATPQPRRTKPAAAVEPAKKDAGWRSKAAIAGGLAAVGAAATAALLSLRGSTPKKGADGKEAEAAKEPAAAAATPNHGHAHMPDGKDATASFEAGIADENVIPE